MTDRDYKTFLVSYDHGWGTYNLEVPAKSPRDAMERLRYAAKYGRVDGELVTTIPATPGAGLLVRMAARLQNWWRGR